MLIGWSRGVIDDLKLLCLKNRFKFLIMVTNNERKGVHMAPQFQMGYDSTHHSMQQGGKKASRDFQTTPYPVIMLPLLIPLEKGAPQLGRG